MLRLVALLSSLMMALSCNSTDQTDLKRDAAKLAESSTRSLGNMGLAVKVITVLSLRKGVDTSTFSVQSEGGTITLDGTVPSHKAKKLVLELVRETKGVERLVDKLRVATPSR